MADVRLEVKEGPIEVKDDIESDSELEALRVAALQTIRLKNNSPPRVIPSFRGAPQSIGIVHKKSAYRRYHTNSNLIAIVPTSCNDADIAPVKEFQSSLGSIRQNESTIQSLPLPQNRYCSSLKPATKQLKKEVPTKFSRIDASESESDDDELLKDKLSSDEEDEKSRKSKFFVTDDNSNKSTEDNENKVNSSIGEKQKDNDDDSLDRLMDVMEQEFSKPNNGNKNLKPQEDLLVNIKKEKTDEYDEESTVPETEVVVYKAKTIKLEKIDDEYVESTSLSKSPEEIGSLAHIEQNDVISSTLHNIETPVFGKLNDIVLESKSITTTKGSSAVPLPFKVRSPQEVNLKFLPNAAQVDIDISDTNKSQVYVNILSDENSLSNTDPIVNNKLISDNITVQLDSHCKSPLRNDSSQFPISVSTKYVNPNLSETNGLQPREVNEVISCRKRSLTRSRSRELIHVRSLSPRKRSLSPRKYGASPLNKKHSSRDRSYSPRGRSRRSYTPRYSRSPLPYPKLASPVRKRYSHSRSPVRRRRRRNSGSRSWSRSASYSRSRSRSRSPYLRYRSRSPFRRSVSRSPGFGKRYLSPRRIFSPRRKSVSPVKRDYSPGRRYSPDRGRRISISPKRRSPFYYRQVSPLFGSRLTNRLTPPPLKRRCSMSPNRRSPYKSTRLSISPRRPASKYDSYSPKRARLSVSPVSRQRTLSPRRRVSPLRSARNSISPKRQFSPGRSPRKRSVSPWERRLVSPRNRSPVSPRKRSSVSPRRRHIKSPTRRVNRSPLSPFRKKSLSPFSSRKRSLSPFASQIPRPGHTTGHQKTIRERFPPSSNYRESRKHSPLSRTANPQRNCTSPSVKRTSVSPRRAERDPKRLSVSPRRLDRESQKLSSVSPRRIDRDQKRTSASPGQIDRLAKKSVSPGRPDRDPKRSSVSPGPTDRESKRLSVSPKRKSDLHSRRRSVTPTGSPRRYSPKRNAASPTLNRSCSPRNQKKSSLVRYKSYGDKKRQFQHHRDPNRALDCDTTRSRSKSRSMSPKTRSDNNEERNTSTHYNSSWRNINQRRRRFVVDRTNKDRDNRRREKRSRDHNDRDKTRENKDYRDRARDRARVNVKEREKDESQEKNEKSKVVAQPAVDEKSTNSDAVLEARRRKFESNNPVQPLNKKIRLKTVTNVDDNSLTSVANDNIIDKLEKPAIVSRNEKRIAIDNSFRTTQVDEGVKQDLKCLPKIKRADSSKSLDKGCNTGDIGSNDLGEEFEGDSLLLLHYDELELEEQLAAAAEHSVQQKLNIVAEKAVEKKKPERKQIKVVKPMPKSSVLNKTCSSLMTRLKQGKEGSHRVKQFDSVSSARAKEECDLRAELCRRRAERLTKIGSSGPEVPTKRLLQSAFVGLIGEKKRMTAKVRQRTIPQIESKVNVTTKGPQALRKVKPAEAGKRRVLLVNHAPARKTGVNIRFPKGFEGSDSQSDSDEDDDDDDDVDDDESDDGNNCEAQDEVINKEMDDPEETNIVLNRKRSRRMPIPIHFRLGVTSEPFPRRRQQIRRRKQVGRFPSIVLDLHGTPSGRGITVDVTTTG